MLETQETQVRPLGQEDPLEEGMETHSSVLARRIPWTEERGGEDIKKKWQEYTEEPYKKRPS